MRESEIWVGFIQQEREKWDLFPLPSPIKLNVRTGAGRKESRVLKKRKFSGKLVFEIGVQVILYDLKTPTQSPWAELSPLGVGEQKYGCVNLVLGMEMWDL